MFLYILTALQIQQQFNHRYAMMKAFSCCLIVLAIIQTISYAMDVQGQTQKFRRLLEDDKSDAGLFYKCRHQ